MTDTFHNRIKQLRWACRRGMQELDMVMLDCLNIAEQNHDEALLDRLERVLNSEDDQLWQYVLGRAEPESQQLSDDLQAILQARQP